MNSSHGTRIAFGAAMMAAFAAIIAVDLLLDTDVGLGCLGILIGTASLLEFYDIADKRGFEPFRLSGLVGGVLIFITSWSEARFSSSISMNPVLLFAVICWLFLLQGLTRNLENVVENVAITIFGMIYVFFFLSFAMALRHMPGVNGLVVVFGILLMAKCSDIGAYFVGREFGSRRLFPVISPNKTLEGAIGGLTASVLVAVAWSLLPKISIMPWVWAVPFGLLVGIASMGGDLMESMLKRDAGVKDSGDLIPSFGGALDIIDCVLISLPAGYYFLTFYNWSA